MRRLPLLLLPLLAGCAAIARDETPFFDKSPEHEARVERAAQSGAQLIAARQAMMHMAATLLYQDVMPVAKNGTDVKAAGHAADGLDLFGHSVAGLFPEGSTGPNSRALPSIWTNNADFVARANAFGDSAARLKQLADAGDQAGFKAQAAVVAGGCNSCHSLYRAQEGGH
ncbi:MAG: cytochrome c [Allosphingosinicella sp.]